MNYKVKSCLKKKKAVVERSIERGSRSTGQGADLAWGMRDQGR